jgi:hypothetical protein
MKAGTPTAGVDPIALRSVTVRDDVKVGRG